MRLHPALRWLGAALLITLSLWAANRAARTGWASYQSIEARSLVGNWVARPGRIDQLEWNRARDGLLTALEWDPENPVYHEQFANLYMVRLPNEPGGHARMRPYFELALRHYYKAAALRPTWPYTHAGIASVKWQLGERDADFRRAIVLASRYGPWEVAVHERLIRLGFGSWDTLGEIEREAIRGNLHRAHQYRPKETGVLLAALGKITPPCAQLRVDVPGACAAPAPAPAPVAPDANATHKRARQ